MIELTTLFYRAKDGFVVNCVELDQLYGVDSREDAVLETNKMVRSILDASSEVNPDNPGDPYIPKKTDRVANAGMAYLINMACRDTPVTPFGTVEINENLRVNLFDMTETDFDPSRYDDEAEKAA